MQRFRAEIESFHERRTAAAWNLGASPSRRNGAQVLEIGADGKPVDGILARRLRDFRFDRTLARTMRD